MTRTTIEVKRMKNRIVGVTVAVVGLIAALFMLSACDIEEVIENAASARVESTLIKTATFDVAGAPTFDVDSSNGSVRITGIEGQSNVQVTATLSSRGETLEEADDRVGRIRIDMSQSGDRITLHYIASEQDADVRKYSGVAFTVTCPPALAEALVDTSNGSISVRKIQGVLDVDTSNGSITVEDFAGEIRGDTSNGSITVRQAEGVLRLDTSNGAIELTNVNVAVDADTSNGRIEFDGTLMGEHHRLSTSNGRIDFRTPADASLRIEARTSNATISTGLPLVGDTQGDSWDAELNPPTTTRVELRTSNGSIRIDGT